MVLVMSPRATLSLRLLVLALLASPLLMGSSAPPEPSLLTAMSTLKEVREGLESRLETMTSLYEDDILDTGSARQAAVRRREVDLHFEYCRELQQLALRFLDTTSHRFPQYSQLWKNHDRRIRKLWKSVLALREEMARNGASGAPAENARRPSRSRARRAASKAPTSPRRVAGRTPKAAPSAAPAAGGGSEANRATAPQKRFPTVAPGPAAPERPRADTAARVRAPGPASPSPERKALLQRYRGAYRRYLEGTRDGLTRARDAFEAIIEEEPRFHLARYWLGRAHLALGEPEKALQQGQALLADQPGLRIARDLVEDSRNALGLLANTARPQVPGRPTPLPFPARSAPPAPAKPGSKAAEPPAKPEVRAPATQKTTKKDGPTPDSAPHPAGTPTETAFSVPVARRERIVTALGGSLLARTPGGHHKAVPPGPRPLPGLDSPAVADSLASLESLAEVPDASTLDPASDGTAGEPLILAAAPDPRGASEPAAGRVQTAAQARPAASAVANGPGRRPIAVMVENSRASWPQTGLDQASLVFEMPVEGGISRFMAVYPGDGQVQTIGPVRSARPYFIELATAMGAIYSHCGGSPEAYQMLRNREHIDQIRNARGFWRVADRKPPHNLYTRLSSLRGRALSAGISLDAAERITPLPVLDTPVPAAQEALLSIELPFSGSYEVRYEYNPASNRFNRYMNSFVHIDGASRKPLEMDNVVVLLAPTRRIDDQGRLSIDLSGEGNVVLFRSGNVFPGRWKGQEGALPRLEDEQGQALTVNPGVTWFHVLPQGKSVKYSYRLPTDAESAYLAAHPEEDVLTALVRAQGGEGTAPRLPLATTLPQIQNLDPSLDPAVESDRKGPWEAPTEGPLGEDSPSGAVAGGDRAQPEAGRGLLDAEGSRNSPDSSPKLLSGADVEKEEAPQAEEERAAAPGPARSRSLTPVQKLMLEVF